MQYCQVQALFVECVLILVLVTLFCFIRMVYNRVCSLLCAFVVVLYCFPVASCLAFVSNVWFWVSCPLASCLLLYRVACCLLPFACCLSLLPLTSRLYPVASSCFFATFVFLVTFCVSLLSLDCYLLFPASILLSLASRFRVLIWPLCCCHLPLTVYPVASSCCLRVLLCEF